MPFSSLNQPHSHSRDGDEIDVPLTQPSKVDGRTALVTTLLDTILSKRERKLLQAAGNAIILQAPTASWAEAIGDTLREMERAPVVDTIVERKRSGGSFHKRGLALLEDVANGRSVVFVSQDPEILLDSEVLAAADATIVVPRPTLPVLRRVILRFTGKTARGLLQSDFAGLDATDMIAALRPGSTPTQCIERLRRAATRKSAPEMSGCPLLEALPLTQNVATWAFDSLATLRKIAADASTNDVLRFAVLEGPPGCGKTTIASALARSAGWRFVSTSVGQWFGGSDGALGDVAKSSKIFFDTLLTSETPIVGLIDEIDALPDRSRLAPREASWWTPVVTGVLTQVDTVRRSRRPILLLGATNHFHRLDSALVRAGRLETRVPVLPPNETERRAMFRHYLPTELSDEVIAVAARLALSATPAAIEASVIAAQAAAAAEHRPLALEHLLKVLVPDDGRSPELRWAVCLHEAGHAIAAREFGLPILEVSTLSVGVAGGWTRAGLDHLLMTKNDVERLGVMMLAGRAADIVLGSGAHAGARSDLEAVNQLVSDAMLGDGLYGTLQVGATTSRLEGFADGRSFPRAIGEELDRLMQLALDLIERRKVDVLKLAEYLRSERVVSGGRMEKVLANDGGHSRRDTCG